MKLKAFVHFQDEAGSDLEFVTNGVRVVLTDFWMRLRMTIDALLK